MNSKLNTHIYINVTETVLSPDCSYSRRSVMNYCKALTGLVIFHHSKQ